jgi:xanthine dehydrogenase YagS FAD-binding subunit
MKSFANANVRDLKEAVTLAQQAARDGRSAAFASGGSDLLPLIKDEIVRPDVIVNLKTIPRADQVDVEGDALSIGGLITLEALSSHPTVRSRYAVLAEAAESVATPQIRRVGTLAGNVCQRPWCWYYRNGFPCYKAGGKTCFTPTGENQFNAIFGGGPSFIVHPSDAAPALVALNASFRIVGPTGERTLSAAEFFVGPRQNPARENVLADDEILASIRVPAVAAGTRSTYEKVMDREAWTHALASAAVVLQMDGEICRAARIVLGGVAPIPWRVPEAERLLNGKRVTESLAKQVGEASVAGARPMSKNRYKVALTRSLVQRTVLELATRV